MKLSISAKCRDLFAMDVMKHGIEIMVYDGYVPSCLGIGGGDYIHLVIDTDTGKIEGWNFKLGELVAECHAQSTVG